MNVEARKAAPPVDRGMLFTRLGDVHEIARPDLTRCGRVFDLKAVAGVSALQAQVHKLRLCVKCYPPVNLTRGGSRGSGQG